MIGGLAMAPATDSPGAASIDALQAGLFYLLSRYAATPSEAIATAVVHQLSVLWAHPQTDLLPVQRDLYAKLINEWRLRGADSREGTQPKWLN